MMKKVVLMAVMIICSIFILSAQIVERDTIPETDSIQMMRISAFASTEDDKTFIPQVIPASPQSQIFERYLNHEISGCTGLPEIEIPFYEIKMKDITIPITLSYDASGVKYMQYDGDIGAGWSIGAAGYRVTRNVKGADDLGIINPYGPPAHNYTKIKTLADLTQEDVRLRDGFLLGISYDPDGPGFPSGASGAIDALVDGDGQYDRFTYMLPTSGGKFIITDRQNKTITHLDEKQDIVDIIGRTEIKITDATGIEYLLGGTSDGLELIEKEKGTQHETAWLLREIRTPSGKSVHFKYKKAFIRSYRYRENITGLTVTDASSLVGAYPDYFEECIPPVKDECEISSVYNRDIPNYEFMLFLDRIEIDNISISFERGDLLDMGYTLPTVTDYILKKIVITDKLTQKVIKEIALNNDVLPSEINTFADYISTPSHLVLNSATISDKKYEMMYYAPPANYKYAYPDQWNNYSFNRQYACLEQKNFLHKEFLDDKFVWKMYYRYLPVNDMFMTLEMRTYYNKYFADRSVDEINVSSFSLKKITYPTGGNTEYVYEPHQTDQGKGGGLRIKKIISHLAIDRPAIISEFRYDTGIPSFILDHTAFCSSSYSMYHERFEFRPGYYIPHPGEWYARFRRSKTYSVNPVGDFSLSDYTVYYRNIDIVQYDESSNKYNGKKSLKYNLPNLPQIDYYDGFYMKAGYFVDDDLGMARGIFRVFDGQKPTIGSVSYYDNTDKLLKQENYEYIKTTENAYKGLKVRRRAFGNNSEVPAYPGNMEAQPLSGDRNDYNYVSSYFDYIQHEIITGAYLLSSKKETLFTPEGNFETTESYDYNDKNQIRRIELKNKDNVITIKDLKYPQDFAFGSNIYQQMVDKNTISPVIEQLLYTGENQEIKRVKTEYGGSWGYGGFRPNVVKTTSEGLERTEITYDRYDSKGNLQQYTTPDGVSTFYLWSYNYQYPIAEIRNATYFEIEQALSEQGKTIGSIACLAVPDLDDSRLRGALPDALVTTYTYEPSVGITSMTDSRGVKFTYYYDVFNRLKYIEDDEGNRIQEYEYHYCTENID